MGNESDEYDEFKNCQLCTEKFSDENKVTLPCFEGHTACLSCWKKWKEGEEKLMRLHNKPKPQNPSCPFCRKTISPIPPENKFKQICGLLCCGSY